jgi:two-component system OmpR family sensor kinase
MTRPDTTEVATTVTTTEWQPARVASEEPATGAPAKTTHRRVGTAARLAAFHLSVFTAVLAIAVIALYRSFQGHVNATTTRDLVAEVKGYEASARARPAGQDLRTFSTGYLRVHVLPDGELLAVALPGHVLLGSAGSGPLLRSPLIQQLSAQPPRSSTTYHTDVNETSYDVLATPIRSSGHASGTVMAAADTSRNSRDLGRVLGLAIGEAVVALLIGVAGTYLLLRRLLRTIGRITTTASEIGKGDVARRLGPQGSDDEVGELAATFDAMTDRLAGAMSSQRRLLSDVSHQLRTPLTVARGHLEVLGRTAADDPTEVRQTVALVVDELEHMNALVERLLTLGRALEPDFLERMPIDLRSFVADIGDTVRVLAARDWRLPPVPDVVISADPAKLRGALLNLIDNAVRATSDGAVIEISANVLGDGSLELAVDDGGPGIPAGQRSAALERFARPGADDVEGSGLGLAIVTAVAQTHGGHVELSESSYGGLRAVIVLPPSAVVGNGEAEREV